MKVISQATACGALATTKKGAIAAAPTQQELFVFMQQQPPLHQRDVFDENICIEQLKGSDIVTFSLKY